MALERRDDLCIERITLYNQLGENMKVKLNTIMNDIKLRKDDTVDFRSMGEFAQSKAEGISNRSLTGQNSFSQVA